MKYNIGDIVYIAIGYNIDVNIAECEVISTIKIQDLNSVNYKYRISTPDIMGLNIITVDENHIFKTVTGARANIPIVKIIKHIKAD